MHQHSDLFVRCIYLSLQNARVQLGMLKLSMFLQQLWYIAQQFFHGSQKLRLHFTPTGNFVSLCSINRFGFISQFGDSFGYHKADHWFSEDKGDYSGIHNLLCHVFHFARFSASSFFVRK
jgi:hypothetical protein